MIISWVRLVDNECSPITEYVYNTRGGDDLIVDYPTGLYNTYFSVNATLGKGY